MEEKKITRRDIRRVMAAIGSVKTKKKTAASKVNIKKAIAKKRAPVAGLEKGWQEVKAGRMTMRQANDAHAHCRFERFSDYCNKKQRELKCVPDEDEEEDVGL